MRSSACLVVASAIFTGSLVAAYNDYEAARCVSWDGNCPDWMANKAEHWCAAGKPASEQNNCCKAKACEFCVNNPGVDICGYPALRSVCFSYVGQASSYACNGGSGGGGPAPQQGGNQLQMQSSSNGVPAAGNGEACIWRQSQGKDSVVINPVGWETGNWQSSGNGITYKPGNYDGHSIDSQGSSTITFRFAVREAGEYLITAKSYAPHSTEFNDCWLRFTSNMKMMRPGGGSEYWSQDWQKAYQNDGSSMKLSSKDHDPHQFVTTSLTAGQVYTVDISGRSTRFKIERLIIAKCKGDCNRDRGDMQDSINDGSFSSCY